jgi:hypothetical protein
MQSNIETNIALEINNHASAHGNRSTCKLHVTLVVVLVTPNMTVYIWVTDKKYMSVLYI